MKTKRNIVIDQWFCYRTNNTVIKNNLKSQKILKPYNKLNDQVLPNHFAIPRLPSLSNDQQKIKLINIFTFSTNVTRCISHNLI